MKIQSWIKKLSQDTTESLMLTQKSNTGKTLFLMEAQWDTLVKLQAYKYIENKH